MGIIRITRHERTRIFLLEPSESNQKLQFGFLPSPWGHRESRRRRSPQINMQFTGQELRDIIGRTPNEIELQNEFGRLCRFLSSAEAQALDMDLFVGIGNRRRIRFLRSRTQRFAVNAGSRTTRRPKNDARVNIAHPLVREHRPVPYK